MSVIGQSILKMGRVKNMEQKQNKNVLLLVFSSALVTLVVILVHPHGQMKRNSLLKACIAEWNTRNQNQSVDNISDHKR
jgi:hypothetical protein